MCCVARVEIQIKFKNFGVLPIRIVWSNVSNIGPYNISYLWNFVSLLGACLVVQLITRIFLAMHYWPNVNLAFDSVSHVLRDVNYGFVLSGATLLFISLYIHMDRNSILEATRKRTSGI